jgi:exopolyphosphatase/pppGpp-phosphohydrolase
MTDDATNMPWSPAMMAKFQEQMQEAGEEAMSTQQELFQQFMQASSGGSGTMSNLAGLTMGSATFKTRVQSGGRISIPDAEREALDIGEGDIVQTIVIPVKRKSDSDE